MSETNSTTERATPAQLTAEDIDQIVEGIQHFIMDGNPEVDAIWQPYVDQLKAQRAILAAAPDLLDALLAASADLDASLHGRRPPMHPLKLSAIYAAAIAKAGVR